MDKKLQQEFAKKWKIDEQAIFTIFRMIQDTGNKYGKVHKTLESFHMKISTRQLRYFYKKVRMWERYDIIEKGKPLNYSELLRKKT